MFHISVRVQSGRLRDRGTWTEGEASGRTLKDAVVEALLLGERLATQALDIGPLVVKDLAISFVLSAETDAEELRPAWAAAHCNLHHIVDILPEGEGRQSHGTRKRSKPDASQTIPE